MQVEPLSPAANAGLRSMDILLSYNEVDIAGETETNSVLQEAIRQAGAMRLPSVKIGIVRDGRVAEVEVPGGMSLGIRYAPSG